MQYATEYIQKFIMQRYDTYFPSITVYKLYEVSHFSHIILWQQIPWTIWSLDFSLTKI